MRIFVLLVILQNGNGLWERQEIDTYANLADCEDAGEVFVGNENNWVCAEAVVK